MMAYAEAGRTSPSTFEVDWVRIRKFVETEPVTTVGSDVSLNTRWTGTVSSDWANAGNWTAGVPEEWSIIDIQGAPNSPLIAGSLTLESGCQLNTGSGWSTDR